MGFHLAARSSDSAVIKGFTSLGAVNWLQGRELVPLLRRHGGGVEGTVLDLGCGSSPFRALFAKAAKFVRVDCHPVDPEVVVADATQLPLAAASVDCVLLAQMIGDVPDLVKLFIEIDRVLRPGGSVLVYETIGYPQHDLPHDYWRVLPGGLAWAADKAGLQSKEVVYLGGYFTQLAMHWNIFIVGDLGGHAIMRPVAWASRALCNLLCAGLDRLMPRPTLATDYFACLVKPVPGDANKARP